MNFTHGQELTTPDGWSAKVLLCAGPNVTVWLTNANRLPRKERFRTYEKAKFPRPDLIGRITK